VECNLELLELVRVPEFSNAGINFYCSLLWVPEILNRGNLSMDGSLINLDKHARMDRRERQRKLMIEEIVVCVEGSEVGRIDRYEKKENCCEAQKKVRCWGKRGRGAKRSVKIDEKGLGKMGEGDERSAKV
jgi:hypothetical protein